MIFDLFISYKSEDREIAEDIRKHLLEIDKTINIFWSEISLADSGNSDYSTVIEAAISNSKNMLVIGTSIDNITSKWVTYEWRLFKHYQLNDKENFYHNLFLAVSDVDVMKLPGALQICECLSVDAYEEIYSYAKNNNQEKYKTNLEKRGFELIQGLFDEIGWSDSVLLTPQMLSKYEDLIAPNLASVTILSHSLTQDSPGGALFDTVESNMSKGIVYDYIFLDAKNAFGILRKIKNGHSIDNQERLILEIAEDSFWALGSFANVTIYEYKNNKASEGYMRVSIQTGDRESPIYLKMSEAFIDNLWNHIESYRSQGLIKKYGG